MKYNISINQYATICSGLDLDLIDLAIFDFIKDFANSRKITTLTDETGCYFWVSHKIIIDNMPLLKIKTANGMMKRIDNLVNAGILVRHSKNKINKLSYYKFGKNYDLLIFRDNEQKLVTHDEISLTHDESIDSLMTKVQFTHDESMRYNIYNNNINNNNISNTASNEIFAEPQETETELFPKQPEEELEERKVAPKERKTLFSNSSIYKACDLDTGNYDGFLSLFNKPEYEQVDLIYYFHSVNDWSDKSDTKRTNKGWIATVRTFMRSDVNKKQLKLKPEYTHTESGISQESMIKYLNDDY